MHELSIAQAIVQVAETEARRADAQRVTRITVDVGSLSGVVEDSLTFCFPIACDGTLAQGAELCIEPVEARGWCRACDREFSMEGLLQTCPGCDGFVSEIRAGQELRVRSIEVL